MKRSCLITNLRSKLSISILYTLVATKIVYFRFLFPEIQKTINIKYLF